METVTVQRPFKAGDRLGMLQKILEDKKILKFLKRNPATIPQFIAKPLQLDEKVIVTNLRT